LDRNDETVPAHREGTIVTKTLIVPVDGSETSKRAWDVARQLAARFASCDLVLLRADLEDGERHRDQLDELARTATTSVRIECVTGDAAGAIIRAIQQEPEAAVCMATHGRGRIAAPLMGSVATEVLRGVERPVLLVGPHCEDHWWHEHPRLVTCWTGEESNALLSAASSWSEDLAAELTILCVFHPLDVDAHVDPAAQFLAARKIHDGSTPKVHAVALYDDYPSGAIVEYARSRRATMLALTTRARQGIGRAVLGSVAMDVIHHSPCPVLAVRRSA
jgi:nucleotide-binding universal stress UspA family protein